TFAAGYLFHLRDGTLMAQPFDADGGKVTGDPFPVVDDVEWNPVSRRAPLSVSASGALAYVARSGESGADHRKILLVDRSGNNARETGKEGLFTSPLPPPDTRQAIVPEQNGSTDRRTLSLLDIERGISTPFTVGDVDERYPIWSPNGSSVVFESPREK